MSFQQITAIAVFAGVMALVVTEKVHRCTAALIGAMVLVFVGVLDFEAGVACIDFNTLGVLLGMMLLVACMKPSGLFQFVAVKAAKIAKGSPWRIMVAFILITAVLSALLDNVTTVLLIGPMTLTICRMLEVDPVPFLISQIAASNIGGTATLIGDPPNIMVGSAANLGFLDFVVVNGPIVAVALAFLVAYLWVLGGRKLTAAASRIEAVMALDERAYILDRGLFAKSITMVGVVAVAFSFHEVLGVESGVIALSAAAVMLVVTRTSIEQVVTDVEWTTIGFFAGLFIVVGGLVETGVIGLLAQAIAAATAGDVVLTMVVLLWASALVSAVLDNIPFVATIIPIVLALGAGGTDIAPLWWAVSLGACLGGNGTLVGASANIVLSSMGNREGHPVTFIGYLKIGFPLMVATVLLANVYLLALFG
ncbi:hypothetical protein C1878_14000 [Gordonibacter sp. 28C]|uniref:ArsB/NhaD family transporter n=1 Tax=Gordonibacter sp. 28C TaxID=2078569 RepID=UPI000DF7AAA5|nr:ArsB/NhaD family transporter [Gordonibacter sp. 28C]RDB60377.1 hypothetical protein C1878_14000 [Gordonibacter sp. 28C]